MDSTAAVDSKRHWGASITTWVAILLLCHPLSIGPLVYLEARGWLDTTPLKPVFTVFYAPEIYLLWNDIPSLAAPAKVLRGYVDWWDNLGKAHAAAAPVATPVSPPTP